MRSTVTVYRRFLRFTHAVKFVVGLISAIVVQIIQNPFRIEFIRRNIQTERTLRNRANISNVAAPGWQEAANAIGFW